MAQLDAYKSIIEKMVQDGQSYENVSMHLKAHLGATRCSAMSFRRFCFANSIRKGGPMISNHQLIADVQAVVNQSGATTGRRMATGYLKAKGIRASERRVGEILKSIHPGYHQERLQGCRNLNPVRYRANYFGEKLHMDQNEKLSMYGLTYVIAVDGFSSKVVAGDVMAIKNNLVIYDNVYRKAVETYGMFNQIRVDKGREFFLTLYMQEKYEDYRPDTSKPSYRQTTSTLNHRVERLWVEVNNRVSYPIKSALIEMEENGQLDMVNNIHKFCVSQFLMQLCKIGLDQWMDGWNNHRIQGRGVPVELSTSHNGTSPPPPLPVGEIAAQQYFQEIGTHLSQPQYIAPNPFPNAQFQQAFEAEFTRQGSPFQSILEAVNNRQYSLLHQNLSLMIACAEQHIA